MQETTIFVSLLHVALLKNIKIYHLINSYIAEPVQNENYAQNQFMISKANLLSCSNLLFNTLSCYNSRIFSELNVSKHDHLQ